MAINRRTQPLPIPGAELQRMREYLAPEYGSEVHGEGDRRILVIRVPRPEPDLVNDIEAAIEYLSPGDVQGIQQALLVGSERMHVVAPQPFQDLMAARVRFDLEQGKSLRSQMQRPGHAVYRAQADPRKHWRLAFRIAKPHVRDLGDDDLAAITEAVGPNLEDPKYKAVRAVYLVADQDDVRIDADLFLDDLMTRWGEESERRELASQIVAKEKADAARAEAERQAVLKELETRAPRVAYAPMKSSAPNAATWEADRPAGPAGSQPATTGLGRSGVPGSPPSSSTSPFGPRVEGDRARMYAWVDSLPAAAATGFGSARAAPGPAIEPASARPQGVVQPTAPAPDVSPPHLAAAVAPVDAPAAAATPAAVTPTPSAPTAPEVPAGLVQLEARLKACGYDVLVRPDVPGHTLDLAAERIGNEPQRVIARVLPRLRDSDAQELVASARALDADLALAVADQADPEAKKRIIATRVRHATSLDLDALRL